MLYSIIRYTKEHEIVWLLLRDWKFWILKVN